MLDCEVNVSFAMISTVKNPRSSKRSSICFCRLEMLIFTLLFARFGKYCAYLPILPPRIDFFRALQYNYTERKRNVNTFRKIILKKD
jgi:hypothetical protein